MFTHSQRTSRVSLLKKSLIGSMLALPLVALANPTMTSNAQRADNLLTFEVTATETLNNDEIHASLNKSVQARDIKGIATQLTPIINRATALKAKYPDVKVSTGAQSSHPTYDRNGKITGYTGYGSIELVSKNNEQISAYISELQSTMNIGNISFAISDELSNQVRERLRNKASQDFMQEAQSLAKLWGASGYRLVQANLNTTNGVASRMVFARDVQAAEVAADAKAYNLQPSDTQLHYTISGTIQLIK